LTILAGSIPADAQEETFQKFLGRYNLTYLMPNQQAKWLIGAVITMDKEGRAHPQFRPVQGVVETIQRDPVAFPSQAGFEKMKSGAALTFLQPFMSLSVEGGYQRVRSVRLQITNADKDLLVLGEFKAELGKLENSNPDYVGSVRNPNNYVVIGVVWGQVVYEFFGSKDTQLQMKV
jgi:hypothetical protein